MGGLIRHKGVYVLLKASVELATCAGISLVGSGLIEAYRALVDASGQTDVSIVAFELPWELGVCLKAVGMLASDSLRNGVQVLSPEATRRHRAAKHRGKVFRASFQTTY